MITRRGLFKRVAGAVVAAFAAPTVVPSMDLASGEDATVWMVAYSENGVFGMFPKPPTESIIELLNETNSILADMPWQELPKRRRRTPLPKVDWRGLK